MPLKDKSLQRFFYTKLGAGRVSQVRTLQTLRLCLWKCGLTGAEIAKIGNCLSNAIHGQNVNLPVSVCVCPSHFVSTRLQVSEKSSDFDEILYTAADFELDEHDVIKNEKMRWTDSELDRTYCFWYKFCPKRVYLLKRFLQNFAWGGSPRPALSCQMSLLSFVKCRLTVVYFIIILFYYYL